MEIIKENIFRHELKKITFQLQSSGVDRSIPDKIMLTWMWTLIFEMRKVIMYDKQTK